MSSLVKDLFKAGKNKKNEIKYLIINVLIKLMEDINIKEIHKNGNPKKGVNVIEKILNFNEQQILTFKKMLQTLPIALEQVKAANTSENVLNEIRQAM